MWQGQVLSIHIAKAAGAPMDTLVSVRAVTGKGLQGDRYFEGTGTYSNRPGSGREVTLIETEALEALKRDYAVEIGPAQARRNIVTEGVPLNDLIDAEFTVGSARLRGRRLCDPCAYLESLSAVGVLRGLIHRGGLRAEIISGGTIRVGDPIAGLLDRSE